MATKEKTASAKKRTSDTSVTRIIATDTKASAKKTKETAAKQHEAKAKHSLGRRLALPFTATGTYFKGAWYELRQVRWPNRRATWSLTAAVLGFTAFFVVLILLLDALFKYVFQLILG